MLRRAGVQLLSGVLGQSIGFTFTVKQYKDTCWTGRSSETDRLSRNVGNYQSTSRNIPEEQKFHLFYRLANYGSEARRLITTNTTDHDETILRQFFPSPILTTHGLETRITKYLALVAEIRGTKVLPPLSTMLRQYEVPKRLLTNRLHYFTHCHLRTV
jgi:hypothetical protein